MVEKLRGPEIEPDVIRPGLLGESATELWAELPPELQAQIERPG